MSEKNIRPCFDERIISDESDRGIVSIHVKRYEFARPFCEGKRVLDVACGTGYGSDYLGITAKEVIGVDISGEAIEYAQKKYAKENVSFRIMDACRLEFPDQFFQVICSFETIEHLSEVETYLIQIKRVITLGGLYFVSTPLAKETTLRAENPFHHQEWAPRDFEHLLKRHFTSVKLFGQRRKQTGLHRFLQKLDFLSLHKKFRLSFFTKTLSHASGTTPFAHMELEDIEIVENDLKQALYLVAVCSNARDGIHL